MVVQEGNNARIRSAENPAIPLTRPERGNKTDLHCPQSSQDRPKSVCFEGPHRGPPLVDHAVTTVDGSCYEYRCDVD